MSHLDLIAGLLADLDTLTRVSEAGLLSRREVRLEPGETRPAAVLFLDLVGFTDLSRVLTSQQLTLLIDRTFQIFELSVRANGGYWDARFGDAALYVFPGHPNYPPACEGALLAAMALIDRARLISDSLKSTGLSVNVRVGVAFGDVTRQRVGGEGQQLTVMGDTVNLAQRLEAASEPGTVQTTLRVLDRAGESVIAEYHGDVLLRGFGTVQVQRLCAVTPRSLRLRGGSRELTPLIGRSDELDRAVQTTLRWLNDDADAGNKLLLIEGPTAIGKSRFAWEVLQRLRYSEPETLNATGHCTELASLLGFAAELLELAGLTSINLLQRWPELCELGAAAQSENYAAHCRGQLATLALILGSTQSDAQALSRLDPQYLQRAVQQAMRAALELSELESGGKPMVLIVEDLQWLGGLHQLVAALLAELRLSRPLVVLATSRNSGVPPALADTGVEIQSLALGPLSEESGRELFSALLPGLELPPAIETELHANAIGLPYYYEEFARMLLRRGIVQPDAPGEDGVALSYHLAQAIDELSIPLDLQMLILGRLDQLDQHLRELTGRASVLGRSFGMPMLRRMEERLGNASGTQLDETIEALIAQQVFERNDDGRIFFAHVLTCQAAYEALLQSNRQQLHYVVAELLRAQHVPGSAGEADLLPDLAVHLLKADMPAEAHNLACQLLALQASSGRFETWEHWESFARACWLKLRSGQPQLPELSQSLLSALAARHTTQGQWEQAEPYYEEALRLAQASGERRGECALLCSLGSLLRSKGELDAGESCYLKALLISRDEKLPQLEAVALRELGGLLRERGSGQEALEYLLRALTQARECNDRRSEALVLDSLGMTYMDRFMADPANDAFQQALSIARELGSPWTEGLVLGNLGLLHMKYLRFKEARECLDRARELAREVGDPRLEGEVAGRRANLLLRTGELDAAEPDLSEAERLLTQVGNRFQLGFVYCQWVYYHVNRGDVDGAREALLSAGRITRELRLAEESALARETVKASAALQQRAETKIPT